MSRRRSAALAAVIALLAPATAAAQDTPALPLVRLTPGLVITRSVRIAPGTYRLPGPASLDSAVITIRGDSITVDFAGAALLGQEPSADPDLAQGVALRVDGGQAVRILNAKIRGYRVAVLARGTRGLSLVNNDASYNWKPRLYSLIEHESLVDWLSFHHNEKREWLRYSAAFYLDGVSGGEIIGNTVVQGMNALLLNRSDHLRIQDNNLSFNSGLGIGLYRSSDNTIVRNRIDYNVRGYSHRFYRRGQDSAGLLLYEQSNRNVVAWNSASHGGDGLFLWAGQSTMDTGEGGANDNLFYGNDFSFAPANAMEATFSRNVFVANRLEGSDYGLWGGYSFDSVILGNCFIRNRIGVAIEHGQNNRISQNRFRGDSLAIKLWADSIEPSDWGYPKHRDTRSRDNRIERNMFAGNRLTILETGSIGTIAQANDSVASPAENCSAEPSDSQIVRWKPDLADVPAEVPAVPLARKDRSAIIVDEWGPFDWRSPKLWPLDSSRADPLHLAVLGPPGEWKVVGRHSIAALSAVSGKVGDTLRVTPGGETPSEWEVTLEYRGGGTVSPRGEPRGPGRPYRFGYGRAEPATEWEARFWTWPDSLGLPTHPERFDDLTRSTAILARRESRLDYEWYRPLVAGLPLSRFALEATTKVVLPPGQYTIRTISDDGIQLWVDGLLVIDHWAPHESAVDMVTVGGGVRNLKVRYYQVDGWTELRVEILKRSPP